MKAKKVVALREYKVVDVAGATALGCKPFTNSEYSKFALVAVRGDKLDTLISWGMNSAGLQKLADKRNKDIKMLGKMMGKAAAMLDAKDETETEAN